MATSSMKYSEVFFSSIKYVVVMIHEHTSAGQLYRLSFAVCPA